MGCTQSAETTIPQAPPILPQPSTEHPQSTNEELSPPHSTQPAIAPPPRLPQHSVEPLDDFTADYMIIQQVMVGASALSHIYMVMKRPKMAINLNNDRNNNNTDNSNTSQTPAKNIDVAVQQGPMPDEIYVCQVIDMESVAPERRKSMRKEIIALQSIVHPNILRVHAVYDATRRDNTIATVTELCTGSHLHSSIPYPEPRAKIIIAQVLDALQYMHQRKIFHNSLTTENILFQDDSQDAPIKITYAGVANLPSQSMNSSSSSHSSNKKSNRFAIPEWNPSGKDVYSVGMIAYKLLSGGKEPPVDMDTQRVVPGTNLFLGRRWKLISISKNAKNFIERCLHSWDMKPQFTVEDALHHIWMTQEHVHRSDTSRVTDTIQELGVANWSDVSHSLTASEPSTLYSNDEIVPIVSLTAEQYTREVKNNTSIDNHAQQLMTNGDHDDNDFPVFVSDAVVPVLVTNNDGYSEVAENVAVEPIVQTTEDCEIINDAVKPTGTDICPADIIMTGDNAEEDAATSDDSVVAIVDLTAATTTTTTTILDVSETQTPDEFIELRDAFREVTTGTDNSDPNTNVTMETFKERLRTRYTEEEVNSWFTGHDKYEDPKRIDYQVFLRKVIQNRKSIEIQRVDTAFKNIDKGRHGYVTVGNLRAVLGKDNNDNIEQLIKTADTNRDGTISYDNFEQVVQNYLSSSVS